MSAAAGFAGYLDDALPSLKPAGPLGIPASLLPGLLVNRHARRHVPAPTINGRDAHFRHDRPHRGIGIFRFREGIDIDLAVDERARDEVRDAVIGGLAMTRIPLGG